MSARAPSHDGKAALSRMVLAARHEPLAWTPTRAASVLGRLRQEQASRTSRKKKAIVGLSLVAAAALGVDAEVHRGFAAAVADGLQLG